LNVANLGLGEFVLVLRDKATNQNLSQGLKFKVEENDQGTRVASIVSHYVDPNTGEYPGYMDSRRLRVRYIASGLEDLSEYSGSACDASPLMVDVEGNLDLNNSRFDMTSQIDGVLFDIFGEGYKSQISWPISPLRNRFLVLPNSKGTVDSVDQLFGDNTLGPDGQMAANGFEALKKYDLNKDLVIDDLDPVFTKLRLWADLNSNGISETGELSTLSEHRIKFVSLDYVEMMEEDQHGNTTRQRSFIETVDGIQRMIIDIWFRPLN
jgi:hypothetical protein